jgi:hypothetical protein
VSLPPDLIAFLERRAGECGTTVSAELADMVARECAADRQSRLDQALALDAEHNRRFARTTFAAARDAFGEPDW